MSKFVKSPCEARSVCLEAGKLLRRTGAVWRMLQVRHVATMRQKEESDQEIGHIAHSNLLCSWQRKQTGSMYHEGAVCMHAANKLLLVLAAALQRPQALIWDPWMQMSAVSVQSSHAAAHSEPVHGISANSV